MMLSNQVIEQPIKHVIGIVLLGAMTTTTTITARGISVACSVYVLKPQNSVIVIIDLMDEWWASTLFL